MKRRWQVVIILITITVLLTLYYARDFIPSPTTGNAISTEEIKDYIVELRKAPASEELARIKDTSPNSEESTLTYSQQSAVKAYASTIRSDQESFKTSLQKTLNKEVLDVSSLEEYNPKTPVPASTIVITHRLNQVLNGLVIRMTEADAEKVKSMPDVLSVKKSQKLVKLDDYYDTIKARDVWTMRLGENKITGKGIKIAVIDSGVDYTHPMLGECTRAQVRKKECSKIADAYNFIDGNKDPMDTEGHGTEVASAAAGSAKIFYGELYAGIAPEAQIMAYKTESDTDAAAAIERAADPNKDGDPSDKADIIVLSIGFPCAGMGGYNREEYGCGPNDVMSKAARNAVKNSDIVVVVAAGNCGPDGNLEKCEGVVADSETIMSPAVLKEVITVGSSNEADAKITGFSSRGNIRIGPYLAVKPDVVAPGENLNLASPNYQLTKDGGTSFSAPQVAGLAALIKQKNPKWKPNRIKAVIVSTTKEFSEPIKRQGYGRVDALAAINFKGGVPNAEITTNKALTSKNVRTPFDIIGRADGSSFVNYKLYYSKGDGVPKWVRIKSSSKLVGKEGVLYSGFNANALPNNGGRLSEGNNYLKLVVTNKDGSEVESLALIYVKR